MKRITLTVLLRDAPTPDLWRADSARYAVSAYGRSVKEAQQRLFVTVNVEKSNRGAFYDGLILTVAREWKHPLDSRPEVR